MERARTPLVLAGAVWATLLAAQPAAAVPVFTLSASCTPSAQGTFTITNTGSSMTGPGTYTLLLNGTPIASNTFQLNAGVSTTISTSGLYGTLELDVSGGGGASTSISTFCMSPTPTPTPAPPVFTLSASCTPSAQGTFTITNTGSSMTGPGTYTLLLNGTPIASNTFQLNAGVSTTISTSGLYGTLELDVSGGGGASKSISTFCPSPTPTPTPTATPTRTPTPPPGTTYHPVPPCRAVDTRTAVAPLGGPALQPLEVRLFKLAGACGVPLTARSLSVNVTAVPSGSGVFEIYPGNEPNPGTSALNFRAGVVRANNAFVLLATDGSGGANVFNGSAAANHLIVDVNGYFQ